MPIPRIARPSATVRKNVMYRGLHSGSLLSLLRPSVVIRRNVLQKGLMGRSSGWLAIGALLWGKDAMKRVFGKREEVLTTEVLKKGQFLSIQALRPPTRRERRAARRAS
jgi:hypothetical protein